MKKLLLVLFAVALLGLAVSCGEAPAETAETTEASETSETSETTPNEENPDMKLSSNEAIKALRETVWQEYVDSLPESRATELVANEISYVTVGRLRMKVETRVFGKMPEDGYPIFIVLHGGGADPTGEMNESQWSGMAGRYANTVRVPGIFVSCRAIEEYL